MLLSLSFPVSDLRTFFADGLGHVGVDFSSLTQQERNSHFLRSAGLSRQRMWGENPHAATEKYYFPLHRICELQLPEPADEISKWHARARSIRYYQLDSACGRIDLNVVARPDGEKVDIDGLWDHVRKGGLGISHRNPRECALDKAGRELCRLFQSRTTAEPVLRLGPIVDAVFSAPPVVFFEAKASEIGPIPKFFSRVQIQVADIRLYYGFLPTKEVAWLIVRDSIERDVFMSARALRIYLSHSYCHQANFRNLSRNMPAMLDKVDDDQILYEGYTKYMIENGRYIASLRKSASEQSGVDLATIATLAEDMVRADEIEAIMARHSEMTSRQNVINNIRRRLHEDSQFNEAKQASPTTQNIIAFFGTVENVRQVAGEGRNGKGISREQLLDDFLDLFHLTEIVAIDVTRERRFEIISLLTDMEYAIKEYRDPVGVVRKKIGRLRSLTTRIARGRSKLDRVLLKFERSLGDLQA
ncbi:hypothetical protein ACFFP0_10860 [Rhizobium puerariae]|uniref:Uncharacterized protein n=1 Tax=Rhizobium puerariae TaxID=1585791 RepID=A0ABV6AFF8_9HYPH